MSCLMYSRESQRIAARFISKRVVKFVMTDGYYRGSEKGIREQKEFEASLPGSWKRILENYRTIDGQKFQMHLGDNYEFRKIENEVETQAMKLYYDWHLHKPKWRLIAGKRYEIKENKIASVVEHEDYAFKQFEQAKSKALELMLSLDS